MKLIACCPMSVDGAKLSPGDAFDATDYSGAKLIARGAAKAAPKGKSKAKKKAEDKAEE